MLPHSLRKLFPRSFRAVVRELSLVFVLADARSLIQYWRMAGQDASPGNESEITRWKIRQLGNQPISIRTNTADAKVIVSAFLQKFHRPPANIVPREAKLILDLGANIGCTMADLACLYPQARVIGVELDSGNASLCVQNTSAWRDRCEVVEGAVWAEDGEVQYEQQTGLEDSFHATTGSLESTEHAKTAPAYSLNTLLDRYATDHDVDYVKMDIEGAECEVLRANTEWADRVKCIKVEVHHGYSKDDCITDLQRLGFRAYADATHFICVVGVRD